MSLRQRQAVAARARARALALARARRVRAAQVAAASLARARAAATRRPVAVKAPRIVVDRPRADVIDRGDPSVGRAFVSDMTGGQRPDVADQVGALELRAATAGINAAADVLPAGEVIAGGWNALMDVISAGSGPNAADFEWNAFADGSKSLDVGTGENSNTIRIGGRAGRLTAGQLADVG